MVECLFRLVMVVVGCVFQVTFGFPFKSSNLIRQTEPTWSNVFRVSEAMNISNSPVQGCVVVTLVSGRL
jgi:hypothetical protein